jgi:hypothetical protein
MRRPLALLLLALCACPLALASQATRDFQKKWAESAGLDEAKKRQLLDDLTAADKTDESAKLLLAVAANENEDAQVTECALRHLAELDGQPGDAWVKDQVVKAHAWGERALLVRALSYRKSDEALKPLAGALHDKQWQVQAAAIEAIARHRVNEAIEALVAGFEKLDLKDDSARRLAGDYKDALERLTGEKLSTATDWKNWWGAHAADFKISGADVPSKQRKEDVTVERAPQLFDEVLSRRVIFILDISGSMQIQTGAAKSKDAPGGLTRFECMRREAKRVVAELPAGAHFNLIAFSDAVLPWQPKMQTAAESTKKKATAWIEALKPEGETNSYGALEAAFKDKDVDTIYFLSDGFPTNGKVIDFTKICGEVQKWNATRNVRVNTIAFLAGDGKALKIQEGDKSLPKKFMSQLAEQNGGVYKVVE